MYVSFPMGATPEFAAHPARAMAVAAMARFMVDTGSLLFVSIVDLVL
jgi:hypothetical protein